MTSGLGAALQEASGFWRSVNSELVAARVARSPRTNLGLRRGVFPEAMAKCLALAALNGNDGKQ